jgi:hypothetical protein
MKTNNTTQEEKSELQKKNWPSGGAATERDRERDGLRKEKEERNKK